MSKYSKEICIRAATLYGRGMQVIEIAKQLGIPKGSTQRAINRGYYVQGLMKPVRREDARAKRPT